MWGAKSGEEQLPPFPEPTHRGKRNPVSNDSKRCVVDFPSQAARHSALPMVRGLGRGGCTPICSDVNRLLDCVCVGSHVVRVVTCDQSGQVQLLCAVCVCAVGGKPSQSCQGEAHLLCCAVLCLCGVMVRCLRARSQPGQGTAPVVYVGVGECRCCGLMKITR